MIACTSCHRQFDVAALEIGAKVRCLCGEILRVPDIQARDMVMQRCASCGGDITDGAPECAYCGTDVSLADRGFGGTCPGCFSRLAKNAKFCCSCGLSIHVTSTLQPLHDKSCPRCDDTLAVQEFTGGSLVECTGCGGVWLEESEFERVSRDHEAHAVSQFVANRPAVPTASTSPATRETKVQYLKCPTCDQFMHRKNFAQASGVIVDWCRGHGYWFDNQELERIIEFIAAGGMDLAREKKLERERAAAWRQNARPAPAMLPGAEPSMFDTTRHAPTNDLLSALGGLLRGIF